MTTVMTGTAETESTLRCELAALKGKLDSVTRDMTITPQVAAEFSAVIDVTLRVMEEKGFDSVVFVKKTPLRR